MMRLLATLVTVALVSRASAVSAAPSSSPSTSPTVLPPLRSSELDALIRIYGDTDGSGWSDCYDLVDPCESCVEPEHDIKCEIFGAERRITELKLANVGMLGTIEVSDLNFFQRLNYIDMGRDGASPSPNAVDFNPESTTSSNVRCVPIEQCLAQDAFCSFGGYVPVLVVCPATPPPTPSPIEALGTPAILGIIGGCVGFVLIGLILFVLWSQRQERLRMQKERRRNAKRRRTQAQRRRGSRNGSRRNLSRNASSRGGRGHGGVQTGKYGAGGSAMKKKGYVPEQSWGANVAPEDQWEELYDYNSGRAYWANNATNQFSWEDPKRFMNTGYDPFFAQNGPGYGHDGGQDWAGSYDVGANYGGQTMAAPPPAPPSRGGGGGGGGPPVAQAYYG